MMAKALSHEELGITFAEYGALIGTRYMLAGGVIKHKSIKSIPRSVDPHVIPYKKHVFNMGIACKIAGCGSVSCIGGTMAMIMGITDADKTEDYVACRTGGLARLFYPAKSDATTLLQGVRYNDISVQEAIQAIDNFLTTGDAQWDKVLLGE